MTETNNTDSKKTAEKKKPTAQEVAETPIGIAYDFAAATDVKTPTIDIDTIVMSDFDSRATSAEPDEPFIADIRDNGINSPLIVSPLGDGRWCLVAGRRRYKAAKLLGLKTVPIAPKTLKDAEGLNAKEQALLLCLSENLNRQDLNAYDLAVQFRHFKELGWSQTLIAKRLNRKDPFVSQYLGIFELDKRTQTVIRTNATDSGVISKARLLKQIKDPEQQVEVAKACFDKVNPWTTTQLNDVVEDIKLKAEAKEKKEKEKADKASAPKKARAKAGDADEAGDEEGEDEDEESEFEKASVALKLAEQRALADLIKSRFEKQREKFAEAPDADAKAKTGEKLAYERGCYDTMKQIFGLKAAPKSVVAE